MRKLYEAMIGSQGGSGTESDLELIKEEEVEPPADRPNLVAGKDSRVSSYGDETGALVDGDHEHILALIKQKYNVGNLTDIEIIENFRRGGFVILEQDRIAYQNARQKAEEFGFKDLDAGREDTEGQFGQKADELVNAWCRRTGRSYGIHREIWLQKRRYLAAAAKRHVGVSGKVSDIDDVGLLRRLIAALEIVAPRELGDG